MKQKSLNKVLTTVAILVAMLILASLTLVGCGNKATPQSPELPAVNKIDFDTNLELTNYTAFPDKTEVTGKNVSDLATAAKYNTITFTAKQNFDMKHFSFTVKSETKANQTIQVFLEVGHQKILFDLYNFNQGGEQQFRYDYLLTNSILGSLSIKSGDTIKLTIGINQNNNSAPENFAEYTNPISLSNFVLGN